MRLLCLVVALAACTDPNGDPIDPCHECGSGAIRGGRFVEDDGSNLGGLVANHTGVMARGAYDRIEWLADDFAIESTQTFAGAPHTTTVLGVGVSSLVDSGDAIAHVTSVDENDDFGDDLASVISLTPDHRERWRLEIGTVSQRYGIVADADVTVMTGNELKISDQSLVLTGDVVALATADASVRWRRRFPQPNDLQLGPRLSPNGDVLISGQLRDPIDFGGSIGTIHAKGSMDAFIAALDRTTGETKWVTPFSVSPTAASQPVGFAVGPGGEIAVIVDWLTITGTPRSRRTARSRSARSPSEARRVSRMRWSSSTATGCRSGPRRVQPRRRSSPTARA